MVTKPKTRELVIRDHVSQLNITEDTDGKLILLYNSYSGLSLGVVAATAVDTCLSLQVYDLVTRRDHVMQLVDCLDDQFTINPTVMRQQFELGTND